MAAAAASAYIEYTLFLSMLVTVGAKCVIIGDIYYPYRTDPSVLALKECNLGVVATGVSASTLSYLQFHHLLDSLQPQMFTDMTSAVYINLSHNNLTAVHNNSFGDSARRLEVLDLSYNRIGYVNNNSFLGMHRLHDLDLSHNTITHIDAAAFKQTPLAKLDLSHNRIAYLEESFYKHLNRANMHMFKFDHNPWDCRCLHELLEELKSMGASSYEQLQMDPEHPLCVISESWHTCQRKNEKHVRAQFDQLEMDFYLM